LVQARARVRGEATRDRVPWVFASSSPKRVQVDEELDEGRVRDP
jgi:hypothetical protein